MFYFEAFCSALIVGLGQILKGETRKGVALMLAFYFALPTLVYTSLFINATLFFYALGIAVISGIMLWLYSVGEALKK